MPRIHTDDSLQEAFDAIVADVKHPEAWYVCLMVKTTYYGGPEEGGWWGHDTEVVAYGTYQSEDEAERVKEAVEKKAAELSREARAEHGRMCSNQVDFLEARGYDADDNSVFGEVGGPDNYYVWVGNHLPQPRRGARHYE